MITFLVKLWYILNLVSKFCLIAETIHSSNKYFNLTETIEFVKKGNEIISSSNCSLHSTKAIMVLGLSGVGKSTLINYLNHVPLVCLKVKGKWRIELEKNTSSLPCGFEIGHTTQSKTIYPSAYTPPGKDFSFIDTPGFQDNRGFTQEISNGVLREQILNKVNELKFLLLVKHNDVLDRGAQFIQTIKRFSDFLGIFSNNNSFENIIKSIGIIVSKVDNDGDTDFEVKQIIKEKIFEIFENSKTNGILTSNEEIVFSQVVKNDQIEIFSNPKKKMRLELFQAYQMLSMLDKMSYINKKLAKIQVKIDTVYLSDFEISIQKSHEDFKNALETSLKTYFEILIKDLISKDLSKNDLELVKKMINLKKINYDTINDLNDFIEINKEFFDRNELKKFKDDELILRFFVRILPEVKQEVMKKSAWNKSNLTRKLTDLITILNLHVKKMLKNLEKNFLNVLEIYTVSFLRKKIRNLYNIDQVEAIRIKLQNFSKILTNQKIDLNKLINNTPEELIENKEKERFLSKFDILNSFIQYLEIITDDDIFLRLEFLSKINDFIKDLNKLYNTKIESKFDSHQGILTFKGYFANMSSILETINTQNTNNLKSVRIYLTHSLFIDTDYFINKDKYSSHSPNLIIISPKIIIKEKATTKTRYNQNFKIDLSCQSIPGYPDGQETINGNEKDGRDGKAGLPGYNAGNLIIYTDQISFENEKQINKFNFGLNIISNGGKGGPGQNGGDGKEGEPGQTPSVEKVPFERYSSFLDEINKHVEDLYDHFCPDSLFKCLIFKSPDKYLPYYSHTQYTNYQFINETDFDNDKTDRCVAGFYENVYFFRELGTRGQRGGNAGKGGIGGIGGNKGIIHIIIKNKLNSIYPTESSDGNVGINGKHGKAGLGGKNGNNVIRGYSNCIEKIGWRIVSSILSLGGRNLFIRQPYFFKHNPAFDEIEFVESIGERGNEIHDQYSQGFFNEQGREQQNKTENIKFYTIKSDYLDFLAEQIKNIKSFESFNLDFAKTVIEESLFIFTPNIMELIERAQKLNLLRNRQLRNYFKQEIIEFYEHTNKSEQDKILLSYILALLSSYFVRYDSVQETGLIMDIRQFTELIINQINRFKELNDQSIKELLKTNYQNNLENKINDAKKLIDLIRNDIKMKIKEIDNEIKKILNEIPQKKSETKQEEKMLINLRQKLRESLEIKQAFAILDMAVSCLSFLNPASFFYASLAKSTLDVGNNLASSPFDKYLPGKIFKSINMKQNIQNYEIYNETIFKAQNEIEKKNITNSKILNSFKKVQKFEELGANDLNEILQFIEEKKLSENEIDEISEQIKKKQQIFVALVNIEKKLKEFQLSNINEFRNQFDENFSNGSLAIFDFKKWKIKQSIHELKSQLLLLIQQFENSVEIKNLFDRIESAVVTMLDIYGRIESLNDKIELINCLTTVSRSRITQKFPEIYHRQIETLKKTINQNIIIERFNQALEVFEYWSFPFYCNLINNFNIHDDSLDIMENKTKILQNLLDIVVNYDVKLNPAINNNIIKFNNPIKFFEWSSDEYQNEIKDLFQGKTIYLHADISNSSLDILRFKSVYIKIEINSSPTDNSTLNSLLEENFFVELIPLGHTMKYKYDNKIKIIKFNFNSAEKIKLKYHYGCYDCKNCGCNESFEKMLNSIPLLSPYTSWEISLIKNPFKKKINKDKIFKDINDLFQRSTKIIVSLLGQGTYIRKNNLIMEECQNTY